MRRRWRSRSRSSVEEEEANHDGAPGLVGVANDGRWLRERRRHVGDGARVRRVSEIEGGSVWIWEAQRRARGGQVGEMGGGQGDGAALSPPGVGAGEVVGRGRAPVASPVGGTGGRRPREGLWAGSWPAGPGGPVSWAAWSSEGGGSFSFLFFIFLCCFISL